MRLAPLLLGHTTLCQPSGPHSGAAGAHSGGRRLRPRRSCANARGRPHRLEGGRIADDRSRTAPGRQRGRRARSEWADAKFKELGFRQGLDRAGDVPQVGAPQRTCEVVGAHAQTAHAGGTGRQPRRRRRRRRRALRRPRRVAGGAGRIARGQDRASSTTACRNSATATTIATAAASATTAPPPRSAPAPAHS